MAVQLFGTNVSWLLLGFVVAQTHSYYTRSAHDSLLLKTLVYGSLFVTIIQSVLEGYFTYGYLDGGWGNPMVGEDVSMAFALTQNLEPVLDSLVGIFIQLFFTWRIWTFCMAVCGRKVRLLAVAICFFIVMTSICGFLAIAIVPFVLIPGARTIIDPDKLVLIWTIASAVADVAITLSMMTILMNAKSRSTIKETRNGISQLLRVTIQTGFLTSTLAIPIGPLYLSGTEGYELTWFPLGKCYLISLLANLNARSHHPTVRPAIARNNVPARGTLLSFQDRGGVDATHSGIMHRPP